MATTEYVVGNIWQLVLPENTWNDYMSFEDFIYKIINDRYFIRVWDIIGLSFSLGSAFAFYFFY